MRLTFPYQTERLGAVRIYGVQHVFELDSDPAEPETVFGTTVSHVPALAILPRSLGQSARRGHRAGRGGAA